MNCVVRAMAKISIIVPVYNVERYVEKCLNSLIHQTFPDIEIICIDDASTDRSSELVTRISETDSRIRVISHSANLGTLQARKNGVQQASGTYLMFVDSDDWLEPDACEKLFKLMSEHQVDVMQFSTNVVPAVPLSAEMIDWVKSFLSPYPGRLEKREILRSCFVEDKFDFNITDKIWRADLCKKAFEKIEDLKLIASEDRYAFFLLAYLAESYLGVPEAVCYNYNLGVGITGGDKLDLERFEKRCSGVQAVKAVGRFLKKEGTFEAYQDEFGEFENKILWDCVDCWYNKLLPEDSGSGYDMLLKYWGAWKITAAIARFHFESQDMVLKKTALNKLTVGIYYRYLGYEPMDEYVQRLINTIEQSDYHLCLFSDEDAPLNKWPGLELDVILLPPSRDANWDEYATRAKVFCQELERRNVSLMLYASPTSHIAWLDTLLLKSLGIWTLHIDEQNEIRRNDWKQMILSKQRGYEEEIAALKKCSNQLKVPFACGVGKALLWLSGRIKKTLTKRGGR